MKTDRRVVGGLGQMPGMEHCKLCFVCLCVVRYFVHYNYVLVFVGHGALEVVHVMLDAVLFPLVLRASGENRVAVLV